MSTRKQYMNNEVTHQEYYEEIAKDLHLSFAESSLLPMIKKALASGDEHLNTIPLLQWDMLALAYINESYARQVFKEHEDGFSLAGMVCALKAMARKDALGRDMTWQQENYQRAMDMMEECPRECIDSERTQECPWCHEKYPVSIHQAPDGFSDEAQSDHEDFCVEILENARFVDEEEL